MSAAGTRPPTPAPGPGADTSSVRHRLGDLDGRMVAGAPPLEAPGPGTPSGRRSSPPAPPPAGLRAGADGPLVASGPPAGRTAGGTAGHPGTEGAKPLRGISIVDLTAFWAGPAASHLLCTLGAEVIKIESHRRPDGMRYATVSPPSDPDWLERSPTFHATNPAKRSVCIDFRTPSGREVLLRLVEGADAVIENFTPRVMDNAGLTYDELRRRREDIIFVRMPGFGLDGPWRDHSGFAQTMEQVSGVGWLTGDPDGEPIIRATMDPVAGIHAAFALLSALEHRRRTGRGQLVEVPMVEVALNVAAEQVITYTAYGQVLARRGNRGPAAPQGVYRCAGTDQWVALAVETDAHWEALGRVVGGRPGTRGRRSSSTAAGSVTTPWTGSWRRGSPARTATPSWPSC
jgi:crotonobetainyl-CoA:carnitine CoA-transferase CaiB-like acyl-CoA transferase